MPTRTPYTMLHTIRQSRRMSAIETLVDVGIGFCVSMWLTHFIMPVWGYEAALGTDLIVVGMFTAAAIVRKYLVRRVFA
jgi:hypothetical protein